ncbi:unnamed protein product [Protopolystoma xenopodis]|uniref:Uncharacterized protein n=1 Tax=Protopolystoma xenopodis TaxID=117903 RepID=A0A3S5BCF7_9PLAT|nr:unnamed protein product [Protopolystoma xenopodis]
MRTDWQTVDSVRSNRTASANDLVWNTNEPNGYIYGEQCTIGRNGFLGDLKCHQSGRARAICQQYAGMETVGNNIYASSTPNTHTFIRNLPNEVLDIFGQFSNGCFEKTNNFKGTLIACAAR